MNVKDAFSFFFFFFETRSYCEAQADLEITFLPPLPPGCWDYTIIQGSKHVLQTRCIPALLAFFLPLTPSFSQKCHL